MSIQSAKLICASPDLEPGSVKVTWMGGELPRAVTLSGNDADNALEQFRAAPDDEARALFLHSLISSRGAPHE